MPISELSLPTRVNLTISAYDEMGAPVETTLQVQLSKCMWLTIALIVMLYTAWGGVEGHFTYPLLHLIQLSSMT